jgi:hypothetical protein
LKLGLRMNFGWGRARVDARAHVRKLLALTFIALASLGWAQDAKSSTFRLDSLDGLEMANARAGIVTYRGRRAVQLLPLPGHENTDEYTLAILTGLDFKDGTIELEVAGAPRSDAPEDARGFIGIAFRVQPHGSRYECFNLRPTNGRADDQFRRNHSTQYHALPDFPWYRLRKESPGVYESYVDLEAAAWTRIKIEGSGTKARLYVNGADQPCLIVNDLKLGETHGQIALWAGATTDAYFSHLVVK